MELLNRSKTEVVISVGDREEHYVIDKEFPFDSDRKRMSVMARNGTNYWIFCKGADNIMEPRINWNGASKSKTMTHLNDFAVKGLRTLVMGRKKLSMKQYEDLLESINTMETSDDPKKERKIYQLYDTSEKQLDYVGVSAIEDKLQDGVPETIEKLISANIRIWVLTGDK